MKVMVIVKASKESEAGQMPSTELLTAMGQYNEQLAQAGILVDGAGLTPSSRGARVHFSGRQRTVIDGPFTETKELIAGFWVWKVKSLAEAIDWVKRCPNPMNEDSDIEIRPFFEADDFGEAFTPELREQEAAVLATGKGLNKPRYLSEPKRVIAGIKRHYTPATRADIPEQWSEFVPQGARIRSIDGSTYFGVCWNVTSDCQFDYLTGVEVSHEAEVSPEFSTIQLEPRRYAVFPHTGHVSTIGQSIDAIWTKWVPDCGLKIPGNAPCLERYSSEFNPVTGMGGMDIWIPLEG